MLTVIFFAYRFTFVACFVQFDTWLLWSVAYELSIPLSIYSSLKKRTMILLVQMQLLPQQTPKTQQHTSQWAHDERKGTRCPNFAILLLYRAPLILVNKEKMMRSWDQDLMFCIIMTKLINTYFCHYLSLMISSYARTSYFHQLPFLEQVRLLLPRLVCQQWRLVLSVSTRTMHLMCVVSPEIWKHIQRALESSSTYFIECIDEGTLPAYPV